MSVALRCRGLARNGRRPGWDDDRGLRMAFGHGIVNSFAIIRAVCRHRGNVSIDLIEQFRHFGNVADIIRRQFHGDDFMRVSINAEVQLAPAAARPDSMFLIQPLALAVYLQAGMPPRLWPQLPVETQRQLAQWVAQLVQRLRPRPIRSEEGHRAEHDVVDG